ncbi:MAG: hypothetical protein IJ729_02375 [Alloprevotella sp.]|nr:hypothetical protein [Alloprevotella sp.]
MTNKTILLPLLTAALLATACAGDDPLVRPTGENGEGTGQPLAHLASGPEPSPFGMPGLKTYMDSEGWFFWNTGDNVFVNVDGTWIKPYKNSITGRQARADFWLDRYLTVDSCQVVYTGNPSKGTMKPDEVKIPSVQHQDYPNDSEHIETDGDCGTAWAVLDDSRNTYFFDLDHKASYLLFMPTTVEAPQADRCKLLSIEVEDMQGKSLCGTYPFSFEKGLITESVTGDAPKITLTLGPGNEGWDLDEKIDTLLANNTPADGAYMVIQPGYHKLKITYTVKYFTLQSSWWNAGISMWEYAYDTGQGWELPEGEYVQGQEGVYKFTRILERNFAPNDYKRINHKLSLIRTDYIYNFQKYYQWDAASDFWTGWDWNTTFQGTVATFPHTNQDSILTYIDRVRGTTAYQNDELVGHPESKTHGTATEDMPYARSAYRTAATMPNANEITWWLQYGKAHRDNSTVWWMREYHDGYTLCKSGVWFLKRSKLVDHDGNHVEPRADRAAPMYEQVFNTQDAYLQYDLRKGSPSSNLRRYYNKEWSNWGRYRRTDPSLSDEWGYDALKRPANTEDYFFLPSFGYYQMRAAEYPKNNVGQSYSGQEFPADVRCTMLKLVGVRGHYWSSTPWPEIMPNAREDIPKPQWFTNNAYYLYCNEDYVSLSWYSKGVDDERQWGYLSNTREDGTPWFQ